MLESAHFLNRPGKVYGIVETDTVWEIDKCVCIHTHTYPYLILVLGRTSMDPSHTLNKACTEGSVVHPVGCRNTQYSKQVTA